MSTPVWQDIIVIIRNEDDSIPFRKKFSAHIFSGSFCLFYFHIRLKSSRCIEIILLLKLFY